MGPCVAIGAVALATYWFFGSRKAAPSAKTVAASRQPANAVVASAASPVALTEPRGASFAAGPVHSLHDEVTSLSAASAELQPQQPSAEDYVRAVQVERRDESWAAATTQELDHDLREKGARLGFHVRSIDCRRASCYSELDFTSLKVAREGFKTVLGPPNQPNCPLRLLFPTNGDEDAPVMGVMIVDCRELRSLEDSGSAQGTAR